MLLIEGAARLEIEERGVIDLGPGDWVMLDAHVRHRVDWTAPETDTIWLAIFVSGPRPTLPPRE